MSWETRGNRALLRALVVALAILGTGADALPVPFFAPAGLRESDGEGPYGPSREDERDETPDDASDLAWPLLRMVARTSRGDSSSRLAQGHGLWGGAFDLLPSRDPRFARRPSYLDVAGAPLPITLCRLTC